MAEPEQEVAIEEGKSRSSSLSVIIAIVFVLLIVLVECTVAMMILPSADDVARMAKVQLANGSGGIDPEDAVDDLLNGLPGETVEIEYGQFDVSVYKPLSNTTARIDLHLFAVVLADDEGDFTELLESNENRLREQVLTILRSAEMTDLTDSGLGLIKRKILEKTNRTVGRTLVQEIVFSNVSVVEM